MRLRRKPARTAAEQRELDDYERRRGRLQSVPAVTPIVTPAPAAAVTPVTATTATTGAPPPALEPPKLELDAAAVAALTSVPGTDAAALGASPAREAAVAQVVDLVQELWVGALDEIEAKTGKRMFPEKFIKGIWRPAAMRLGVKYLPEVDGDITDLVTITVPVASTVYVARKLAKVPLKKRDDAPAAAVGAPAPERPPAAAAATPEPVKPPGKNDVY